MNALSTTGFVYLSNTHFPQQLVKIAVVIVEPSSSLSQGIIPLELASCEPVGDLLAPGKVTVKVEDTWYIAFLWVNRPTPSQKRSDLRMARIVKGSHSFTRHPRVFPRIEWTILAFAFHALLVGPGEMEGWAVRP